MKVAKTLLLQRPTLLILSLANLAPTCRVFGGPRRTPMVPGGIGGISLVTTTQRMALRQLHTRGQWEHLLSLDKALAEPACAISNVVLQAYLGPKPRTSAMVVRAANHDWAGVEKILRDPRTLPCHIGVTRPSGCTYASYTQDNDEWGNAVGGKTALHYAVEDNQIHIAQLLLAKETKNASSLATTRGSVNLTHPYPRSSHPLPPYPMKPCPLTPDTDGHFSRNGACAPSLLLTQTQPEPESLVPAHT